METRSDAQVVSRILSALKQHQTFDQIDTNLIKDIYSQTRSNASGSKELVSHIKQMVENDLDVQQLYYLTEAVMLSFMRHAPAPGPNHPFLRSNELSSYLYGAIARQLNYAPRLGDEQNKLKSEPDAAPAPMARLNGIVFAAWAKNVDLAQKSAKYAATEIHFKLLPMVAANDPNALQKMRDMNDAFTRLVTELDSDSPFIAKMLDQTKQARVDEYQFEPSKRKRAGSVPRLMFAAKEWSQKAAATPAQVKADLVRYQKELEVELRYKDTECKRMKHAFVSALNAANAHHRDVRDAFKEAFVYCANNHIEIDIDKLLGGFFSRRMTNLLGAALFADKNAATADVAAELRTLAMNVRVSSVGQSLAQ